MKLYSFDIFDTLITRTTATPRGIFALMQKCLNEDSSYSDIPVNVRNNFYHLRIQNEAVARNTFLSDTVKDITLEQIYQCMKGTADLSDVQAERLEELEIQTECENSIPIEENICHLKNLTEQGKRVILVSNMYLSQEVIRRMLVQADPVFADITMYVSSESGKTKGTWTLYDYVKRREQTEYGEWEHFGDHPILDVEIPRKLGMAANQYTPAVCLPWEQEFLRDREGNAALQLLIGASLNARRKMKKGYSYTVGAGYGGVLFYPYVEWLLQESLRKGIRRLYFIARDGYVLKEIADRIIAYRKLDIRTYYLYGSRKAWRLPSVTVEDFDMEEFLTWNYPGQIYSYEGIAQIFEMTVSELQQFLSFPVEENAEISQEIVREVFRMLAANQKAVADYIRQRQREKRNGAAEYLKQEIGREESRFAFVDLIGSGYTQKCLAGLLSGWYQGMVETFFYRLDSCRIYEKNRNYSFYPNRLKLGNIIEVLCGADHGQTTGYIKGHDSKEAWKPVLDEDEGQFLNEYGFQEYLEGIRSYTDELVSQHFWNDPSLQDLSVPTLYFAYMANAKDMELYQYVADMPYAVRGTGNEVKCFAPALSDKALRQLYLFHKGEPVRKYYSGYSLEFSLLRLSEKQKKKKDWYEKYGEAAVFRWIRKQIVKRSGIRRITSKYEMIADRIILYGAGKRGQLLYQQLTEGKEYHAQILAWIDRNAEACRENGLDVWGIEKISEVPAYDQVVIAVLDKGAAEEIMKSLTDSGVPGYKILWIRPDPMVR